MGEYTFKIIENGVEREAEILFTFNNEENNKDYIVYTLNELDESGNVKTYASALVPSDDGNAKLESISEEEYDIVDALLADIVKNAQEGTLDEYLEGMGY